MVHDNQTREDEPWHKYNWVAHTQILLDSFVRWTGQELIPRHGSPDDQAAALFNASFVVVSHGTQADPILNYGNHIALELWEMEIPTLIQTPSRLTAEPMHRDERAKLLERTTRDGFVDDYRGIRIRNRRPVLLIERAIVWNLLNAEEQRVGQAATFSAWKFLEA